MAPKKTIDDIALAIERARRSVHFFAAGTIADVDPMLQIAGVGKVKLPLSPKRAKEIMAVGRPAPYGKGTQTLVDKTVRDTVEFEPTEITLSDQWEQSIAAALKAVAVAIGLPPDRLQATLYKLLVYQKGGFFLPHRDSEKLDRMVASMIVMLPSSFSGGELIIEHDSERKSFAFPKSASGQAAEYVAFYADCKHEVRKVLRGVRVCLAYNLTLTTLAKKTRQPKPDDAADTLVTSMNQWMQTRSTDPLVFTLEHQYTASGLKPDLLKGEDRAIASAIINAAKVADCRVHFGQVSRHLCQEANDGYYDEDRWSSRQVKISSLNIGEVYDDEMMVDGWKDAQGKTVNLGSLSVDESMLVSHEPLDKWKPTREEYEGYTGNAGNTLDRWYHKSAIIVWSNRHHFDVLVRIGLNESIATLLAMRAKLAKTAATKLEQACDDCEALLRAIINRWSSRSNRASPTHDADVKLREKFTAELPKFEDSALIREFLDVVAARDWTLPLDKLIVECCRVFDAGDMLQILTDFLAKMPEPNQYGHRPAEGLPLRDAQWLQSLACERSQGGFSKTQLRSLCRAAFGRFHKQVTEASPNYPSNSDEVRDTWTSLFKASLASDDFDSATQLREQIQAYPIRFDLRQFQVKTCADVIEWSAKRLSDRPRHLANWLSAIRQELQKLTQDLPQPPSDFARNSKYQGTDNLGTVLAMFLHDPAAESTSIRGLKQDLENLDRTISKQRLDVTTRLDRSTRPFSLIVTKTTASYHRAVEQYQSDLKLLDSLPS